ncbi:WXG100 family type VII secretion target [Nocardia sp. NEAU-G5]|uniref:ESAT-6-like protein n=1 Tax=Nocardia albiluteola TaxID=2842303 RepID=A0ABS6ATX3_9NOCA|nr:WXG100 family type VII secretion target [Nocardia albiluteola]MBU3060686.1 WXG100 family type VII secretion target [Nocardia albiluteola]
MTGEYSVDLEQLDNIVTRLSSLAGFLTEHLDTLDHKSASVHSGSWTGATATAHETAHREWAAAARELVQGVRDMSTAARNAHTQYTAVQSANTRMFRRR